MGVCVAKRYKLNVTIDAALGSTDVTQTQKRKLESVWGKGVGKKGSETFSVLSQGGRLIKNGVRF